jgi:hypothetical protein
MKEIDRTLQARLERGKGYFVLTNGRQIARPIGLTEGERVQVIENCCKQITDLITLLS